MKFHCIYLRYTAWCYRVMYKVVTIVKKINIPATHTLTQFLSCAQSSHNL